MFLLIILLIAGSIILMSLSIMPLVMDKLSFWQKQKEEKLGAQLDSMFYDKSPKLIARLYLILPPIGLITGLIFNSVLFAVLGVFGGLFIPNLILRMRQAQRRMKFNNQILDAIMILSSSLKGGLSLIQALEVVVEEMPLPMNQEIGLVVRGNKMGVSLEDSLRRLDKRINMEELSLVINSIMVARETGGDLTKVLARLSTTIRDNRKLKDSIRTLTLQGRLQGIIMSALPFLFIWWVITFNKQHFDIMLQTDTGRMLLFIAGFLQVIGMILIKKFSEIRI